MYKYKAKVNRVIDGDTIECTVDLGFYTFMVHRFRLLYINAPEVKGLEKEEGLRSKEYLRSRLEGKDIIVETEKDDSFGRWLAVIYFEGKDINEELVRLGYATPYEK